MQSDSSFLVEVVYAEQMMSFLHENLYFLEFRLLVHQKTDRDMDLWLSI